MATGELPSGEFSSQSAENCPEQGRLWLRSETLSGMRVWVCGVRGSTAAPGFEFSGYGGHTSCIAIAHDGELPSLILDAGTGIRRVSDLFESTVGLLEG